MFNPLNHWLSRAGKASTAISDEAWDAVFPENPMFAYLSQRDEYRLRDLAEKCLGRIPVVAGKEMQVTEYIKLTIAAQMALPILNLGVDHYHDVKEIVVYPDLFLSYWQSTDRAGVVHNRRRVLSGESWQRGPVILSWAHSHPEKEVLSYPSNVVIHEFAHKLDQLNGSMNGMPALHRDMDIPAWTHIMSQAFNRLNAECKDQQAQEFDPYAATKPAEFFAVSSEYFFLAPQILFDFSPDVYAQLSLYYRQDPLIYYMDQSLPDHIVKMDGDPHLLA
ncbi:MAG: Unknown protein [uncultured Thiotrichaceae bacterium]|uniref:Inner membrane protein n=1 Tax=uncultured Thiotrichaceae bacterium TaxID=298394 RepID=A0A6S6UFU7_9GAMM|nr:MAG: Unknown protein [uncultured Thiotrichaceae bacterium]